MQEIKSKLQKELENYTNSKAEFIPFYPGMNVLKSPLYEQQLKAILEGLKEEKTVDVKKFQMYLDTVIINMHTKAKKYKQSIYFNNENIKDIENQGYVVPFYIDEDKNTYVLLGIEKKSLV